MRNKLFFILVTLSFCIADDINLAGTEWEYDGQGFQLYFESEQEELQYYYSNPVIPITSASIFQTSWSCPQIDELTKEQEEWFAAQKKAMKQQSQDLARQYQKLILQELKFSKKGKKVVGKKHFLMPKSYFILEGYWDTDNGNVRFFTDRKEFENAQEKISSDEYWYEEEKGEAAPVEEAPAEEDIDQGGIGSEYFRFQVGEIIVNKKRDRMILRAGNVYLTTHYSIGYNLSKKTKEYSDSRYWLTAKGRAESELKSRATIEAKLKYKKSGLFSLKDEYETKNEYNKRVRKQKRIIEELMPVIAAEDKDRKNQKASMAENRAKEETLREYNLKVNSLEESTFKIINIGAYDAEDETFLIKISSNRSEGLYTNPEETYKVKIPRSQARSYKDNYRTARVEGFRRLDDDLITFEYFNLVTIHPVTGTSFAFGPTKDANLLKGLAPIVNKDNVIPPDLTMKAAFIENNNNGYLDAKETGKIKVSISNHGKGSAMGVFLDLVSKEEVSGLDYESSKFIGEIQAGDTKSTVFEISGLKSIESGLNKFMIEAQESYGFPPEPLIIIFQSYEFIPPNIQLIDYGIITANGDNITRPGILTDIEARIQNTGQGLAENVIFNINLPTGVYFGPDSKTHYEFKSLAPGEYKDLKFSFTPSKNVGKIIEINIGYTEESNSDKFTIDLEVDKPEKSIEEFVVQGKKISNVEIQDVATISIDIENNLPKASSINANALAVVFGIENYKNVSNVSFAKRDATWIKKYFKQVLGIPEHLIYFMTDSDVGMAEFQKVFSKGGWLDKRTKENTNIYVYYAGHGAPDISTNKAYLLPYDGDPNYASQTGYSLDKLYKNLNNLNAQNVTVFIDACFSGADRESDMLLADARPVLVEVEGPLALGNITIFSASSAREISSAWPEKKHGLFSYFLMKGLQGDADINKDNQITVNELGSYIQQNVNEIAGLLDREQNPQVTTNDNNKVILKY